MNPLTNLSRKLEKSLTTRGAFGTIGHLVRSTPHHLKNSLLLQASHAQPIPDEFDSLYDGIDTAGVIKLSNLKVADSDWKFGHGYQAIRPGDFSDLFQALPLNFSQFVFIDIGSGKGRALLLAAAYPYQAIIGVELVDELHVIAEKNILQFPDAKKMGKNISSVCCNALSFSLPDQPLVIFMYNPFTERVLAQFVDNVIHSVTRQPRDVYLYYWNDRYSEVLESAGLTAIQSGISAGDPWSIYKILADQCQHRI